MQPFSKWLLAALLAVGATATVAAQPPLPSAESRISPVDGQWYFRGDPTKPCYVQTIPDPRGWYQVFTNEHGTSATGSVSRSGRHVTIPEWNLTGTVRGNRLVWPNGDYWQR